MGTGHDASDVAITTSFGIANLLSPLSTPDHDFDETYLSQLEWIANKGLAQNHAMREVQQ
ncbi:MAG: hypothetical protein ACYCSN_16970 [Acidobacteriaceae bacterium]